MTWALAIINVLFLVAGYRAQATAAPHEIPRTITVRVFNGKNAKPIKDEPLNIWFDKDKSPVFYQTDVTGQFTLQLENNHAASLRYLPTSYVDCRYRQLTFAGMELPLSIDEILANGLVTDNHCGKAHADPIPGVLVIYVRPMTFMEKWRL